VPDQTISEFRRALLGLPEELRGEGRALVLESVEACAAEVRAAYAAHKSTVGKRAAEHLAENVVVRKIESAGGVSAVVLSMSPHSHLYEYGTAARSDRGMNRGTMPAQPTMIPIARRWRARVVDRLKETVKAMGFEVSGE